MCFPLYQINNGTQEPKEKNKVLMICMFESPSSNWDWFINVHFASCSFEKARDVVSYSKESFPIMLLYAGRMLRLRGTFINLLLCKITLYGAARDS